MCTLTLAPLSDRRVRVAFNRDEQPTRPPALPPTVRAVGDRRAVFPTDPPSGGTWLAVNDAGLMLAVLNVTPANPPAAGGRQSRGTIIPALLNCDTPAEALAELEQAFDYRTFAPFRLVVVGNGLAADVRWDGRQPMVMTRLLGGTPLLFTSSGLGDHLVEGIRRELFDQFFAAPAADWAAAQDEYHRHRWPGREHLSVNMKRDTARTVSHAVVTIDDDTAAFAYHPAAPQEGGELTVVHLPLAVCVS